MNVWQVRNYCIFSSSPDHAHHRCAVADLDVTIADNVKNLVASTENGGIFIDNVDTQFASVDLSVGEMSCGVLGRQCVQLVYVRFFP
jgi:hypothetical protein